MFRLSWRALSRATWGAPGESHCTHIHTQQHTHMTNVCAPLLSAVWVSSLLYYVRNISGGYDATAASASMPSSMAFLISLLLQNR